MGKHCEENLCVLKNFLRMNEFGACMTNLRNAKSMKIIKVQSCHIIENYYKISIPIPYEKKRFYLSTFSCFYKFF